jgi:hypothetical protein
MKPVNVKAAIEKAILAEQREEAKRQGFFDGRFRTRIEKNRKKEFSKKACRAFKYGLASVLLQAYRNGIDLHQITVRQAVLPNDSAATFVSYDYCPLNVANEQAKVFFTPVELEYSKARQSVGIGKISMYGYVSPYSERVRLYLNAGICALNFTRSQRFDWEVEKREFNWLVCPTLEASAGVSYDLVNTGWDFLTLSVEWHQRYSMEAFGRETIVGKDSFFGNLRVGLQYSVNRARNAAYSCPTF